MFDGMGWLDGEAARRGAWRGVGGEYGVAEKSSKISILKRKPHTPYLKIIPSSRLRLLASSSALLAARCFHKNRKKWDRKKVDKIHKLREN